MDTNVVVDLVRRRDPVRSNFQQACNSSTSLFISAFVLQELLFGVEASGRYDEELAKLERVLQAVTILPFEVSDATVGGKVQADMARRGRKAPPGDFAVGVHALARGQRLVTANTRHFEHIPGLQLLNWRLPPEQQEPPHG